MQWTKGDPKPGNWPEWLKEADISWCDVEIGPEGYVNWLNGVWESGTWENGTWVNGSWELGDWLDGTWENGTWQGGHWENGTWVDGVWHSGTWESGTWRNGTWRDGVWHSGTWRNGTWRNGTWRNGTWRNGTWESGHQRKPRFGWSLDSDGLILGFDGGYWQSKTAEEWQETLQGKDPFKLAELEGLLTWIRKTPKPTTLLEVSIWDHLKQD